jgi:hypothetical protein
MPFPLVVMPPRVRMPFPLVVMPPYCRERALELSGLSSSQLRVLLYTDLSKGCGCASRRT